MQRCIDDFQIVLVLDDLRVDTDGLHLVKIRLIYILTDNLYQLLVPLELYIFNLYLSHLVDDALVVWSKHLRTVFPVSLVSVVLWLAVMFTPACAFR